MQYPPNHGKQLKLLSWQNHYNPTNNPNKFTPFNFMKILISQLPQSPWWQNGVPLYDDNPAMRLGAIPDQVLLEKERSDLISILKDLNVEIIKLPFPSLFPVLITLIQLNMILFTLEIPSLQIKKGRP